MLLHLLLEHLEVHGGLLFEALDVLELGLLLFFLRVVAVLLHTLEDGLDVLIPGNEREGAFGARVGATSQQRLQEVLGQLDELVGLRQPRRPPGARFLQPLHVPAG